ERQNSRWGKEQGYCVVNGQKVPIQRGTNTDPGKAGSEAGQLRTIPAPWAVASGGVGQDDAGAIDAELRTGDERLCERLWGGEIGGERRVHRRQPGEVEGTDGTTPS